LRRHPDRHVGNAKSHQALPILTDVASLFSDLASTRGPGAKSTTAPASASEISDVNANVALDTEASELERLGGRDRRRSGDITFSRRIQTEKPETRNGGAPVPTTVLHGVSSRFSLSLAPLLMVVRLSGFEPDCNEKSNAATS
jgi:hypothetical protein